MIIASFKQDYNIDMTYEWLENISAKRFNILLNGITKNTALGMKIQNKFLEKNSKEIPQTRKNKNSTELTFDFTTDKKANHNFWQVAKSAFGNN